MASLHSTYLVENEADLQHNRSAMVEVILHYIIHIEKINGLLWKVSVFHRIKSIPQFLWPIMLVHVYIRSYCHS